MKYVRNTLIEYWGMKEWKKQQKDKMNKKDKSHRTKNRYKNKNRGKQELPFSTDVLSAVQVTWRGMTNDNHGKNVKRKGLEFFKTLFNHVPAKIECQ